MPIFLTALVLAGSVALYWPTVASLAGQWSLGNYRHGWLVAAISIALLARAHRRIGAANIRPNLAAAGALLLVSLAWAVLYRANLQAAHQALWPLITWLAWTALLGRDIARISAFAAGFFYFAVPLWDLLVPGLQSIAAAVVGFLLKAIGISAFIAGDLIQVAAGDFLVADGCSGLNFLVIALSLATLYGELMSAGRRARWKLVGIAAALALLGNWIRIFAIVVIGVRTDMRSPLIDAHATFGWWIFAGVLVVFFVAASRMRMDPSAAPLTTPREPPRIPFAVALCSAIVAFNAGPAVLALAPGTTGDAPAIELHAKPDGFEAAANASMRWMPLFEGSPLTATATYHSPQGDVEVFVARYGEQREGAELAGSGNSLLTGSGVLTIIERRVLESPARLNEWRLEDEHHDSWILWYSYRVGEREFVSGYAEALWYGVASLRSTPVSEVIAVRTRCQADCGNARALLAQFWKTKWGP